MIIHDEVHNDDDDDDYEDEEEKEEEESGGGDQRRGSAEGEEDSYRALTSTLQTKVNQNCNGHTFSPDVADPRQLNQKSQSVDDLSMTGEDYQALSAKEESDLELLMSECQVAMSNAELFAEQLSKQLSVLDGVGSAHVCCIWLSFEKHSGELCGERVCMFVCVCVFLHNTS